MTFYFLSNKAPAGRRGGPWTKQQLQAMIARANACGMKVGDIQLHAMPHAILGTPERDRDIENVQQSVRVAGQLGIPVIQYGFHAFPAVEGLYEKPGRGGSVYRAFDIARMTNESPVPGVATADDEAMWERLKYFLRAVVPVAEKAGVKLALHPNDPPIPSHRGIAQPFDTVEHWKRTVNFLPSPANGIVLETGVATEVGGSAVELIHYFGKRNCINHVHFRNTRAMAPTFQYEETFIDEGQTDMLAAMRALVEVGYQGMLVPDHTPAIKGDDIDHFGAWGYTLGYIKGLMKAAG